MGGLSVSMTSNLSESSAVVIPGFGEGKVSSLEGSCIPCSSGREEVAGIGRLPSLYAEGRGEHGLMMVGGLASVACKVLPSLHQTRFCHPPTPPTPPPPSPPSPILLLLLHYTLGLRTDNFEAVSLWRATDEEAADDVALSETAK
jgi:hypothetical protein